MNTLDTGKSALALYCSAQACGDGSAIYSVATYRDTGLEVVPGAVIACIERGMTSEDEIVNAVARASRCKRRTVILLLEALTGDDPRQHLWQRKGDRFSMLLTDAEPSAGTRPVIVTH